MKANLSPYVVERTSVDANDPSFFEHSTVMPILSQESSLDSEFQTKEAEEIPSRKRKSSGEPLGFFDLFEMHEQVQHSSTYLFPPSAPIPRSESLATLSTEVQSQKKQARLTECFSLPKHFHRCRSEEKIRPLLSRNHLHTVWKASFRSTRKVFAVKFLPAPVRQHHNEKNRWCMRSEIDLHRKMKHPYIARLCGFLKNIPISEEASKKACALVVEYIPHGSLHEQLKSRKTLGESGFDERYSCSVIAQLCSALRYMHNTHHVVHCDVKLANILYDTDRRIVKLIDFGLAVDTLFIQRCNAISTADAFNQLQLLRRGTLNYLSPEQVTGAVEHAQLCKIDVWALGVCAYELLMGCSPFEMESEAMTRRTICTGRVSFKSEIAHVSDAAVSFIRACLQTDPRKRPSIDVLMKHRWLNQ